MVRFYERAEFLKLQQEWKGKLRASGFLDYEDRRGLRCDRTNHSDVAHLSAPGFEQHAAYFVLAGRWLHAKVWSRRLTKRLWELHCEGVGIRMATVRMRPAMDNSKAGNERRLYAARAEMLRWSGTEVMAGGELDIEAASLFAQSMVAEGYAPDGVQVEADGL